MFDSRKSLQPGGRWASRSCKGSWHSSCTPSRKRANHRNNDSFYQVGEKGKVVTVQDVIPQSRLSRYGNYPYDNYREMMYNREKPLHCPEDLAAGADIDGNHEPWMLIEVEHEFRKLTRNCSQPYDLYNGFKPIDCVEVEESIRKKYPVLAKKCQPSVIGNYRTHSVRAVILRGARKEQSVPWAVVLDRSRFKDKTSRGSFLSFLTIPNIFICIYIFSVSYVI